MFRHWFQRRPAPRPSEANPGQGAVVNLALSGGGERRLNLVGVLAGALRAKGETVKERASWLETPGGLRLLPQFVGAARNEDGRWQVTTTVEAIHAVHFPGGIFEFQHTVDPELERALHQGFVQFADLDFPVLADSLRGTLRDCTALKVKRSPAPLDPPCSRRVILGPLIHFVNEKSAVAPELDLHPFCPCCFFTHLNEAMRPLLQRRDFLAVRFFAARSAEGEASVDCRLNGIEWPEGQQAVLAYTATWPRRGFELRKQYVAIQAAE